MLTPTAVVAVALAAALLAAQRLLAEPATHVNAPLPPHLQAWRARGRMLAVPQGHEMFVLEAGDAASDDVVVLIHGFPTSSHDFHLVLPLFERTGARVVTFDHVGFGLSDKPAEYGYSLMDHADNVLHLLAALNVTRAHFVAHDMGDSVLTEIVARRDRGLLPCGLENVVRSLTFTNGGMRYHLINFQWGQLVLVNPLIGRYVAAFGAVDSRGRVYRSSIRKLWPVARGDTAAEAVREQALNDMYAVTRHNGGLYRLHQLVSYLPERRVWDSRWVDALSRLDVPVLLWWSDSDDVSPLTIPASLESLIPKAVQTPVGWLAGVGHFGMLQSPDAWAAPVLAHIGGA
eukprot:Unigene13042_Nuclearia_a/m.39551 Unigene13042_Nuclearia_a/g.39551  ORF Unigene13042_Nuclearia_a/g.39551 Unigene13042_Nuclearia_a/m.39551 type:complete len:345 (-) Unigene13042_Nuclearia_a:79-1113(-)